MNRKNRRRDHKNIGKSFWRSIDRCKFPENGKDLIMYTKYGKEHLGIYKHPMFLAFVQGVKQFIPFGRSEIVKWEYCKKVKSEEINSVSQINLA